MECVPDLAFLQMAAASNNEILNKMMWHTSSAGGGGGGGGGVTSHGGGASATTMKQRKTNFTTREVEALLAAVAERKETVLFGVAGGLGWARAWHEVAQQVSAVEGIHRSESDVRKKWTYLKWEAKNTSKPGRDPTSRAVLDILTSRDLESPSSNSLLEQLLVPGSPSSTSPVPIAPKKPPPPQTPPQQPSHPQPVSHPQPPPEVCLKWNSYHSNMQATFPSLLNNEQFVDVTLACEGRSIKCHKVMLSACSSYFEELLSQNPCQHPIVFMRDLKFWEVQALVEFMYSGEVNVTQEKLPSLLAAAEALQIKGLTTNCGGSSNPQTQDDESMASTEGDEPGSHQPPQKRARKRKSAHPTAYPIRLQQSPPVTSPAPSMSKLKVPPLIPQLMAATSHSPIQAHSQEPSLYHHPPIRIKREPCDTPPLALLKTDVKEEPLDLGMDSTDSRIKESENNGAGTTNTSLQEAIHRLHNKQLSSASPVGGGIKTESNGGLSEEEAETRGSGEERSPRPDPGDE